MVEAQGEPPQLQDPEPAGNAAGNKGSALLVLAMVLGACLGGGIISAAYHALTAEAPTAARTTTTVIRQTPSVITAVKNLARLETASYHVERVIDLRDKQTSLFGMVKAEDAILLVAA